MKISKKQISKLFKYFNIKHWKNGKNTLRNSINIQCPFCNDGSNHLCVFKDEFKGYCWRCDDTYSLYNILKTLECIKNIDEYNNIINKIKTTINTQDDKKEVVKNKQSNSVSLPKHFKFIEDDDIPTLIWNFLISRNISIETCNKNYIGYCMFGKYKHRLVIPIIHKNRLVAFQARDTTGRANVKYLTSDNSVNDFLYKYDDAKSDSIIIVEGVFDALRIKNAICTFGTQISIKQRKLILNKEPEEIVFCWDNGAYGKAAKHANWFMPFIPSVKVVLFPENEDPDSYGFDNTMELIKKTNPL